MKNRIGRTIRPNRWLCLLIICLSAFLCLLLGFPNSEQSVVLALAYGTFAGVLTTLSMRYLGYFQLLRPYPRKSDALLIFVSGLFSLVVITSLFILLGGQLELRFLYSLPVLLIFSGLAFWIDHQIHSFRHKIQKRKVVLDLTPIESIRLIKELVELDYLAHLDLLSREDLDKAIELGEEREIELIIMSRSSWNQREFHNALIRAHLVGIPIREHHHVMQDLTGRLSLDSDDLWTFITGATRQTLSLQAYQGLKLLFEPLLAALFIFLLSPFLMVIGILILLQRDGPVFYRQTRRGYLGKPFTLYKLRSMRQDSETNGPQWSAPEDLRVTRLGRLLRRYRIDELPQLWNIVKGDMSFCGPRPERPEIFNLLKDQIPLFHLRTLVRPGITGWAQISSGYASSIEESQLKLEYDLFYIKHKSPRLDLVILIKTLMLSFLGAEKNQYRTKLLINKYLYARTGS